MRTKKTDQDGKEYEVDEWITQGLKAEDLLSQFRTSYYPRIAITWTAWTSSG